MDINYYRQFEPIDGKWYITKELGSGAFGTVFEIERRDFSQIRAALKVISIPASQSEVKSFREENYDMDDNSVTSYFYGFVEEFIKEFQVMSRLKGYTNIVSYEDHSVVPKKEGFGWDIFIRMELLTPMSEHFRSHPMKRSDIIKLGIDICKALEICQRNNIIHRDIKPSNIFVSSSGDFKLGDFGVARTLEKTSSALSKKGTYTYMAPEVFKNESYSFSVDTYSLGILLYKLLNNNMEPFRKDKTYSDGENALAMRLRGSEMPPPANADKGLADIILKACSYDPKGRYDTPAGMRADLERELRSQTRNEYLNQDSGTVAYDPSTGGADPSQTESTVSLFGDSAAPASSASAADFGNESTVSMFGSEGTVGMFTSSDKPASPRKDTPVRTAPSKATDSFTEEPVPPTKETTANSQRSTTANTSAADSTSDSAESAAGTVTFKCPHCGRIHVDTSCPKFCPYCGRIMPLYEQQAPGYQQQLCPPQNPGYGQYAPQYQTYIPQEPRKTAGQIYAEFWKKSFTFSGCSTRREYWIAVLMHCLVIAGVTVLLGILAVATLVPAVSGLLYIVFLIPSAIAGISLGVRRLHDIGKGGVWYLISFIPFGAFVLLVFFCFNSVYVNNPYRMANNFYGMNGNRPY